MLSEKHKARHEKNLDKVDPLLIGLIAETQKVLDERESEIDLLCIEGARSLKRQKQLFAAGASTVVEKGRHLVGPSGTCKAVDVLPVLDGEIRWDWPLIRIVIDAAKEAAHRLGLSLDDDVEFGADWRKFPDGAHWQLRWKKHPA